MENFLKCSFKNADIQLKIIRLKLHSEHFRQWKINHLYLIRKYLGKNSEFQSDFSFDKKF